MLLLSCLLLLFVCTFPTPLAGEQCKPDALRPCKAECQNGTNFDLSLAFDFPMNISGQYIWSPCDGYNCTSTQQPGMDCAVCQGTWANCGKMSNPVWIWEEPGDGHEMANWRIEYTFGEYWRFSVFQFVFDEEVDEPIILFLGETPALQYTFRVIGKCLGQPSISCYKYYEQRKKKRS